MPPRDEPTENAPSKSRCLRGTNLERDPVIEAYKQGLDRTLFLENLKLTIPERLRKAQQLQESAEAMRTVGRRLRDPSRRDT